MDSICRLYNYLFGVFSLSLACFLSLLACCYNYWWIWHLERFHLAPVNWFHTGVLLIPQIHFEHLRDTYILTNVKLYTPTRPSKTIYVNLMTIQKMIARFLSFTIPLMILILSIDFTQPFINTTKSLRKFSRFVSYVMCANATVCYTIIINLRSSKYISH